MSIPEQAREPAWSALEPQQARLRRVGDAWAKRIVTALGRPGQLLVRDYDHARPAAYYQFLPEDGTRRLFLKTVDQQRLESQLQSNRIADWLADNALPVSPRLYSYPRRLHPDYHLFAYRQIDGRFARPEPADLYALGELLGRTHQALRSLPWSEQIRTRSAQRDAMFQRLHASARKRRDPRIPMWVSQTCLPKSNAQVIHADLNLGNLLFGKASGQPALLDFEDANHNWHSPLVDLAMALERFVLVREHDDQAALRLGTSLIEGYLGTTEQRLVVNQDPVAILQALASRSMLLLANTPYSTSTRSEMDKFLFLHQQAERRRHLLDTLWDDLACRVTSGC